MKSGRIDLMELAKQNGESAVAKEIKSYEIKSANKWIDKKCGKIKRGRKTNGK